MITVAVAGGKGGVGKTTLTANLGVAMASTGQRVLLFDADLGLADLDIALGLKPETSIQHVIEGLVPMSEAVSRGPAGIRVLAGGSGISAMLRLSRKRLEMTLSQIEEFKASTDILVFDVASGADARVMTFLKMANKAILVTTPEPASIVDCYSTAKVLLRHKKDAAISILVNRVQNEKQARVVFETIQSTVEKFLHKTVDCLGYIRNDDKAAEIAATRKPFVLDAPNLPASIDIKNIAASLIKMCSKRTMQEVKAA